MKDFAHCGVDVHLVPGNHDNMVLEPNVRVLASSAACSRLGGPRTAAGRARQGLAADAGPYIAVVGSAAAARARTS